MQGKRMSFNKYWHDDKWIKDNIPVVEEFDYSGIDCLQKFEGTHPQVMKPRIDKVNWNFERDISKNVYSFKERFRKFVERYTGWRPAEYKNYRLIK